MDAPNPLIMASRVRGADVYSLDGQRMGYVDDLSIDKATGSVAYAILAIGGFLGLGESLHPVPWALLDYEAHQGGFVVATDWRRLKDAPSLTKDQLEDLGAGDTWRARVFDFYGRNDTYTA